MQNQIRTGYKQTEVGAIPEDWRIATLGELCAFENGDRGVNYPSGNDFVASGIPFVNAGHLGLGKIKTDKLDYITRSKFEILGNGKFQPNDVLFCLRGSLGKFAVVGVDTPEGAVASSLIIIRPRPKALTVQFFVSYLGSKICSEMIDLWAGGAAQPNLGGRELARFLVPIPPAIEEQRAIAEALSDADGLLAALEAIVAKKRDLKQAAMQRLLTGKTRLPGFSGGWRVKRLGDHVRFLKNGTLSRAQLTFDATVKYLHYGDIHGSASLWLHPESAGMPCVNPDLVASLDRLEVGDLIFADASEDLHGVGKSIEVSDCSGSEVVSGLHTIAARFDKEILADGFKAYLQFMPPFRDHLKSMAAGTKVLATNRKHIGSAVLALPEPPEQTAIAEVLSDMDADLAALDAQVAKARAVKKGMMQELLTGKVRLI
tara:strand:+ start:4466 stop:5755 length:1290 start_codon:yes stop_codon:yes gene_type:complete